MIIYLRYFQKEGNMESTLYLATQHISQIENLEHSIFGNVNTLMSFGLGYNDAQKVSLYLDEVEARGF